MRFSVCLLGVEQQTSGEEELYSLEYISSQQGLKNRHLRIKASF